MKTILPLILWISILLTFFFTSVNAQELKIYQVDVEQGDATLIITPGGKTMLIDCGGTKSGERVNAILNRERISHIDVLVVTHYDKDHIQGVNNLLNNGLMKISRVYDRGQKASHGYTAVFQDYVDLLGKNAVSLDPGDTISLDPAMTIQCIASNGRVKMTQQVEEGDDENDKSVVLYITYGDFDYFNGGDIAKVTEENIFHNHPLRKVEVCKANHHGSHLSSDSAFMQMLEPTVIIISNGTNKTYQHPRKITLDCYLKKIKPASAVFQTNKYSGEGDEAGNVGDDYIGDLNKETTDEGNLLVSVDLACQKFSVQMRDKKYNYFLTP